MLESREAISPLAWHDARGWPLDGSRRYRLRFAPGALPPVQAFWSLTLYGAHDCMLVDNPIDRHAIADRTPGLCPDSDGDGGLTIHIRHAPPASQKHPAPPLPPPPEPPSPCPPAHP